MTDDQKENYEERAAIMEFDGGLSRADAERLAMKCVLSNSSFPVDQESSQDAH